MAIYFSFAELLDYPSHGLEDCANQIARECAEARSSIEAFQSATRGKSLGELQEIYINAFDFRPDCTPNLGYHLFGDDGRRGLFLAELKGRMEACGIVLGSELPDYLSIILRYIDRVEEERIPLIEDCIQPGLARMTEILDATENPYRHAIHALLSFLEHEAKSREGVEAARV
ncbi:MAG TPA: molecular chaperone TorD family protein [Bryobacteraceae bacterium]|nr:molecular chaperone TorD family protein [Bryobacteraceae bacterium]